MQHQIHAYKSVHILKQWFPVVHTCFILPMMTMVIASEADPPPGGPTRRYGRLPTWSDESEQEDYHLRLSGPDPRRTWLSLLAEDSMQWWYDIHHFRKIDIKWHWYICQHHQTIGNSSTIPSQHSATVYRGQRQKLAEHNSHSGWYSTTITNKITNSPTNDQQQCSINDWCYSNKFYTGKARTLTVAANRHSIGIKIKARPRVRTRMAQKKS